MDIKYQIEVIKERDPSVKNTIEILLFPGFWVLIFYRIAHMFYRARMFFIARFISQFARIITGIEIHPGAKIGKGLFIDHGSGVVIGETAIIGNDVIMYQGVTLGGTGKDKGKRHPTIGNNVLLGAGAKVLGPIRIGSHSRIGAGSVVLKDVRPCSTVVGIPGRAVGKGKPKKITKDEMLEHSILPDPIAFDIEEINCKIDNIEESIRILKSKKINHKI